MKKFEPSRRDFLKTAGLITGAAAITPING
ncbi:MAG: twin-arginine translocation signal domain-containing protein, partial [Blastocatellia bacterium]